MELELLEEEIDKLIYSQNIDLFYDEYETTDPDSVIIRANKPAIIIINTKFETNIPIVARKSHELAHVLYGSDEPSVYNFSIGLQKDAEVIANQGMVHILAKLAFYETPSDYRSTYKFMEAFHLPVSEYEKMVTETIESV